MWKGVISFGMVSIPVRLYVATESHSVSFRQLCAEHLSPIKYKRWCLSGDHEVAYSDIVKGYEVGTDNYVVIQDNELDNLPLPTARAISIGEFVPNDDIEGGLYFKSAYYIEPEQAGLKPYHLLRRALAETGMTAVAKVACRDREHLCSLRPVDGVLLMNTLHWPDEIRPVAELKGVDGDVDVNPRELPDDHPAWSLEAEYVALGILAIVLVASPERIVAGGGVMERPGLLADVGAQLVELNAGYLDNPLIGEEIGRYVVAPALGDQAGVLGAIALARSAHAPAVR